MIIYIYIYTYKVKITRKIILFKYNKLSELYSMFVYEFFYLNIKLLKYILIII